MQKQSLAEALDKAIEMEEKGYKFYQETSQKSTNDITKKTFDFLAEQETFHIESIKNFYNALKEKGDFPAINLEEAKSKRSQDFTLFSQNIKDLKEKINLSDDDQKACEFAMELENSGYRYYENMLKETKDENLSKLLKFLLEEETKHYEGIMELYTYLTDSANWFMYEEGAFPQGG